MGALLLSPFATQSRSAKAGRCWDSAGGAGAGSVCCRTCDKAALGLDVLASVLRASKKKSKKVELRREKPHLVLLHFARLLAVTSAEQRLELLVFYFNLCTAPGLAEVWQPGEGFLRLRGRVCSRAASHMGAGQGLILRTHGSVGLARPRSAPRAPCASHGPERVEVGVWWPRVAPYPLPGTAPSHA